jgi:hypothetical protein
MGVSIFQELEEKVISHNLPLAEDCRFVLFSKSGFTSDLEKLAAEGKSIVLTSGLV